MCPCREQSGIDQGLSVPTFSVSGAWDLESLSGPNLAGESSPGLGDNCASPRKEVLQYRTGIFSPLVHN